MTKAEQVSEDRACAAGLRLCRSRCRRGACLADRWSWWPEDRYAPADLAEIVAGAPSAPVLVEVFGLSGTVVSIGVGVFAYTAVVLAPAGELMRPRTVA